MSYILLHELCSREFIFFHVTWTNLEVMFSGKNAKHRRSSSCSYFQVRLPKDPSSLCGLLRSVLKTRVRHQCNTHILKRRISCILSVTKKWFNTSLTWPDTMSISNKKQKEKILLVTLSPKQWPTRTYYTMSSFHLALKYGSPNIKWILKEPNVENFDKPDTKGRTLP